VDRCYRRTVSPLGQLCFTGGRDTLAAAAIASQLFAPIFTATALSGPLADLLRANSPHELVKAPLLVAQGGADPLVLDFRPYPGLDHLSLVAADSPLTPALVAWTPGPAWSADPPTTPAEPPTSGIWRTDAWGGPAGAAGGWQDMAQFGATGDRRSARGSILVAAAGARSAEDASHA
jgi:hypothetical protein